MRFLTRLSIFGIRVAPILLVIYWILLFTGTHLPGSLLQGDVKVNDKTLHFVAYAGLAFLLAWSLPRRVGPLPGLWVVAAVTVLYAILDEWTQGFVPRRSPDVADFLADMLGMSVGLISYLLLKRLLFPNRPQQPRWQAG